MAIEKSFRGFVLIALGILLAGCNTLQPIVYDYTAYKQSRPQSLLVLPPLNRAPDVKASNSVLSYATMPLAEAGYYVIPVAVMAETFRQNGMTNPDEVHAVSPGKLREIFGADAALYIEILEYGTSYRILTSDTIVSARAKLIDLRDGKLLWEGSASASSGENRNRNQQGGFAGLLIQAIVEQVINTTFDQSHMIANTMTNRLVSTGTQRGILYGPRSPKYGTD